MQPGCDLQQAAVAPRPAVRALELVKEAQRKRAHALKVLHAAVGAQEVIVHTLLQHIRDDRALIAIAVAIRLAVVLEKDAVAQAAARDDDVLTARELHERVDDDGTGDNEVGTL